MKLSEHGIRSIELDGQRGVRIVRSNGSEIPPQHVTNVLLYLLLATAEPPQSHGCKGSPVAKPRYRWGWYSRQWRVVRIENTINPLVLPTQRVGHFTAFMQLPTKQRPGESVLIDSARAFTVLSRCWFDNGHGL